MTRLASILLLLGAVALQARAPAFVRDWGSHPAVVELEGVRRVVAISDVHGALPQLLATMQATGLVPEAGPEDDPLDPCGRPWIGGDTTLVFTGDFGDRGAYTREVYDLLECMEPRAAAAGGRLVPLLGNHETMLVSGEVARRAERAAPGRREGYQATVASLTKGGQDLAHVVGPRGDVGRAVRRMGVMAVVNGQVGFMHGGLGVPRTRAQLAASLREVVDGEAWDEHAFVSPRTRKAAAACPVWARDWWGDQKHVDAMLGSLGVERLVFGHSYAALTEPPGVGEAGRGQVLSDGRLFKIDVGMCPSYGFSQGGALEILFREDAAPIYRAVYPDRPSVRFP
jgi:hypothetical protein